MLQSRKITGASLLFGMAFAFAMLFGTGSAQAATRTWDGEFDTNLSTGANWVGDVAPVDGDDFVFDSDTYDFSANNLVNDLADGFNVVGIVFNGTESDLPTFDQQSTNGITLGGPITNNNTNGRPQFNLPITLSTGATLTGPLFFNSSVNLGANTPTLVNSSTTSMYFGGVISGAGGLNVDGRVFLDNTNTFDGAIATTSGSVLIAGNSDNALGSVSGDTTIVSGAQLTVTLGSGGDTTIAENISIGGTGIGAGDGQQALNIQEAGGSGGGIPTELADYPDMTFSGTITPTADFEVFAFKGITQSTITFSDVATTSFAITNGTNSGLTLDIGGTVQQPSTITSTLSDDSPSTELTIYPNEIVTVNGARGDTAVFGTLLGNGTVGNLFLYSAILSPGESPGCIDSGNLTFDSGSSLSIEIGGNTVCAAYDQTDVTGTVTLANATLNTSLINDFSPLVNDEFIIINNDGADAVSGTFTGLDNGATFSVSGVTFRINYDGGDGNDVVLTAVAGANTEAPDTGLPLADNSIAISVISTLLGTLSLAAAIRFARNKS